MYQEPSGSRIVGDMTHVWATPSSNVNRPNYNTHLTSNLSIGSIHSPNYSLPPPPNYFGSNTFIQPITQSEPMYLSNWRVNVKSIKLEEGDTTLIAELSGTLLAYDRQTILYEIYDAGRLDSVISNNVVRTNNGVYQLLGPIIQGYPNNLYRACLLAEGIPKTWKYVLTQFSGQLPDTNQRMTSTTANDVVHKIGIRIMELIKSFRVLRVLAITADRKSKERINTGEPSDLVRIQFQQKIFRSLRNVNDEIIKEIKELLKHD